MELHSTHAKSRIQSMKHIKSMKQTDRETLASVFKGMAQPRFAESARKVEEDANHEITKHTNNQGSER